MGFSVVDSLLALSPPAANASPEDAKRAMIMQVGMILFMVVVRADSDLLGNFVIGFYFCGFPMAAR